MPIHLLMTSRLHKVVDVLSEFVANFVNIDFSPTENPYNNVIQVGTKPGKFMLICV